MSKIKSFRGSLTDGEEEQIYIAGGDKDTGYRIVKLELFPSKPGQETVENVVIVTKTSVTTSTSAITVDFSDDNLLAAATFHESHSDARIDTQVAVFDNEPFNQDIFISQTDTVGHTDVNYYLELEEFKMKDPEIAVVNYRAALLHGEWN